MKRFFIIFIIFALSGALVSVLNLRNENVRLAGNQRALMSDIRHYITKDSLNVASVERLTLTKNELQTHCDELTQTVEDLNIKIRRLQSISRTATQTEYRIEPVFRDSITVSVRDSLIIDTIRCLDYSDEWLTFAACEKSDGVLDAAIETRDTLITIVHRVPKRFLFFRFGTKAIRQEVISKNPHSRISYAEYIEIK
jgi:hypothetical protein